MIGFFCAGLPDFESRIVGGQNALPGQFPYMAAFHAGFQGNYMCGGAILNQNWVVTVVDAFWPNFPSDIFVMVGTHLLSSGGVRHQMSLFVPHPDYKFIVNNLNNNIALARVGNPFTFTNLVQPIQISNIDIGAGVPAIVTGWGYTQVIATNCNEYLPITNCFK